MPIREFQIREDFEMLRDFIPQAFQYPENDAWSVDPDDMQDLRRTAGNFHRGYALFQVIKLFWKPARDVMSGYVWEENGQVVGLTNLSRKGGSNQWLIENVCVLPDYRRQGIARQLVQACIERARSRGGEQITLDVIDGNTPAYNFYLNMGFSHYTSRLEYVLEGPATVIDQPIVQLYSMGLGDWKTLYTLASRITPADVQQFEEVAANKYKLPLFMRVFLPLFFRLSGHLQHAYFVTDDDGEVGGVLSLVAPRYRNCTISASFSEACAHLRPAVLTQAVEEIRETNETSRIEFNMPSWQAYGEDTLPETVGFTKRATYHRCGVSLK